MSTLVVGAAEAQPVYAAAAGFEVVVDRSVGLLRGVRNPTAA